MAKKTGGSPQPIQRPIPVNRPEKFSDPGGTKRSNEPNRGQEGGGDDRPRR